MLEPSSNAYVPHSPSRLSDQIWHGHLQICSCLAEICLRPPFIRNTLQPLPRRQFIPPVPTCRNLSRGVEGEAA